MTNKQERTIKFITEILDVEYNGKNDYDAWAFIRDHLSDAKFAQRKKSWQIDDDLADEYGYDASMFC